MGNNDEKSPLFKALLAGRIRADNTITGGEVLRDSIERGEFTGGHWFRWSEDDNNLLDGRLRSKKEARPTEIAQLRTDRIHWFLLLYQGLITRTARHLSFINSLPESPSHGKVPTICDDMNAVGKLCGILEKAEALAQGIGVAGNLALTTEPINEDFVFLYSGAVIDLWGDELQKKRKEQVRQRGPYGNAHREYSIEHQINNLRIRLSFAGYWLKVLSGSDAGQKGKAKAEITSYVALGLGAAYQKVLGDDIDSKTDKRFTYLLGFAYKTLGLKLANLKHPIERVIEELGRHSKCRHGDCCTPPPLKNDSTESTRSSTPCPYSWIFLPDFVV